MAAIWRKGDHLLKGDRGSSSCVSAFFEYRFVLKLSSSRREMNAEREGQKRVKKRGFYSAPGNIKSFYHDTIIPIISGDEANPKLLGSPFQIILALTMHVCIDLPLHRPFSASRRRGRTGCIRTRYLLINKLH